MVETHSLTTWPAKQWKQFLHEYILTVDGAFERANALASVWLIHFYETTIRIAPPFLIWFVPWRMLAFSQHFLGVYPLCKVKMQEYIQSITNSLCLCSLFKLETLKSTSKIPQRLRQCNHSGAIWINGEDESRITFLHAFQTACTFF